MLVSIGAYARKIIYENRRGCPDWMVVHNGYIYLVELKSPTGKLTITQVNEHARILTEGDFQVTVLKTYNDIDKFIEEIDS